MPCTCPHCGRGFKTDHVSGRHLKVCDPNYTPKVRECVCGFETTLRRDMDSHRKSCDAWQCRDKEAVAKARRETTLQKRYGGGVTHMRHIPGVNEQIRSTCLAKYGAENQFSRESSLFGDVQEKSQANRTYHSGSDNAFAKPEVKAKIRQTMRDRYGAEHPQQVPEVRARTRVTNLERYGAEETLAAPVIRERIRATNVERYGGPAPSCSPEVKSKQMQTNMERYGVPWTAMDPDIRRRQLETMEANYGSHFFASEEGKARIRASMIEKYGVDHISKVDGWWDRVVETFVERYGAAHPLQLVEFLEKQRATCQENYGVDNPLQSPEVMARVVATCQERYGSDHYFSSADFRDGCQKRWGVDTPLQAEEVLERYRSTSMKNWGAPHAMQNREHARQRLEKMGRPGMNGLEKKVAALAPGLLYTGDGSFWRWLPALGHHKNPDFILPGPIGDKPKKSVTKVVEAFGDYWHSRIFTGKAPFDHEQDLIAAFDEVGIACLVLWENEVNTDPDGVEARLQEFLENDLSPQNVASIGS